MNPPFLKTKFVAECPNCHHEFEIGGEKAALSGLKCSVCQTEFIPEKIHKINPNPELVKLSQEKDERSQAVISALDSLEKIERIRKTANLFERLAMLFGIIGLIALFIALKLSISELNGGSSAWIIFGGSFTSAFWFYLIAQVTFIRANTER